MAFGLFKVLSSSSLPALRGPIAQQLGRGSFDMGVPRQSDDARPCAVHLSTTATSTGSTTSQGRPVAVGRERASMLATPPIKQLRCLTPSSHFISDHTAMCETSGTFSSARRESAPLSRMAVRTSHCPQGAVSIGEAPLAAALQPQVGPPHSGVQTTGIQTNGEVPAPGARTQTGATLPGAVRVAVYCVTWTADELVDRLEAVQAGCRSWLHQVQLTHDSTHTLEEYGFAQVVTLDAAAADALGFCDVEVLDNQTKSSRLLHREAPGHAWQLVGARALDVQDMELLQTCDLPEANERALPTSVLTLPAVWRWAYSAAAAYLRSQATEERAVTPSSNSTPQQVPTATWDQLEEALAAACCSACRQDLDSTVGAGARGHRDVSLPDSRLAALQVLLRASPKLRSAVKPSASFTASMRRNSSVGLLHRPQMVPV